MRSEQTESCSVLLALIGRSWPSATNDDGRRRLDDPGDVVRFETACALRRDIPVVPVLLQGARMPRADELPDDLKDLAFRNGVELSHPRWPSDVQILIKALRAFVPVDTSSDAQRPTSEIRVSDLAGGTREPLIEHGINQGRRWLLPMVLVATTLVVSRRHMVDSRSRQSSPVQVSATPTSAAKVSATGLASPKADTKTDKQPPTEAPLSPPSLSAPAPKIEPATQVTDPKRNVRVPEPQPTITSPQPSSPSSLSATAAKIEPAAQVTDPKRNVRVPEPQPTNPSPQRSSPGLRRTTSTAMATLKQLADHLDGVCVSPFVWREATPGDKVCVSAEVRRRTEAENRAANENRLPGGGGCKVLLVYRMATLTDFVCVPSFRAIRRSKTT